MALSKRLRYEVLRRDGYACRYCGRSAPEVALTVDHVLAVALGGKDEAANLVACCKDCNAGKSSTTPDAPLVADVANDVVRWSAAVRQAVDAAMADLKGAIAYRDQFTTHWNRWHLGEDAERHLPLDETWRQSVEDFRARGLPIEILGECVRIAMSRRRVKSDQVFRYMCGIAWNKITEIEAAARTIVTGVERADTDGDGWGASSTAPMEIDFDDEAGRSFCIGWLAPSGHLGDQVEPTVEELWTLTAHARAARAVGYGNETIFWAAEMAGRARHAELFPHLQSPREIWDTAASDESDWFRAELAQLTVTPEQLAIYLHDAEGLPEDNPAGQKAQD